MNAKYYEWLGCAFGLCGAGLLAINTSVSGYGFLAFLVSNLCWIGFSLKIKARGLLMMQLGFTLTSLIGLVRWFS